MLLNRTLLIAALFLAPLSMADEGSVSDSGAKASVSDQGVPAPEERTTPPGQRELSTTTELPPILQGILDAVQGQGRAQNGKGGQVVLNPRRTLPKLPDHKLVMGPDSTGRVFIKFDDAARVRMDAAGKLSAVQAIDLAPVKEIIAGMGLTIRPAFSKSAERLRAIEIRAEAYSGKQQPDLAGMYYLEGPIGRDLETAARALNGMGVVEVVEFEKELVTSQAVGACCVPNGGVTTCSTLSSAVCATSGGEYFGDGSLCGAGGACPAQVGACCDIAGSCTIQKQANCTAVGNTFRGDFNCAQVDCTLGACCIVQAGGGTTCLSMTQTDCIANSGFYSGDGVACSPDPCAGFTLGACCLWDGLSGSAFCLMLPQTSNTPLGCEERGGYFIAGVTCSTASCTPGADQGACCIPASSGNTCILATLIECDIAGGNFTLGVGCSGSLECDTVGACCIAGDCQIIRQSLCAAPNIFLGVGSTCNAANGDPCADPDCGVASTGSCFLAGGQDDGSGGTRIIGPYCDDTECCNLVCSIDPFCCDDQMFQIRDSEVDPLGFPIFRQGNWDSQCAMVAIQVCAGTTPTQICGSPLASGPCFEQHSGRGCVDSSCCNDVCTIDPQCCNFQWDAGCAALAIQNCSTTSAGPTPNFSDAQGYLTPSSWPNPIPDILTSCLVTDFVTDIPWRGYTGEGMNLAGLEDLGQTLLDTYGVGTANLTRGATIRVGVIEHTAFPDHEELAGKIITEESLDLDGGAPGPTILIISNIEALSGNHGTATLGIVGAKDDGAVGPGADEVGIVGVAPEASLYFFPIVSVEQPGGRFLDAVASALEVFEPGDVLSFSIGFANATLVSSAADWTMLRLAADLGITSCIAAGNDCFNLDAAPEAGGDAGSSGAIIVGACTPGGPFCRLGFSNHCEDCNAGTPVDCSAWGTAVATIGYGDAFNDPAFPGLRTYTGCFGGTSAAAPQVAGLVARLQGLAKQFYGIPLTPAQIRTSVSTGGFLQCGVLPENVPGTVDGFECVGDYTTDEPRNYISFYSDPFVSASSIIQGGFFDGNPLVGNIVVVVGDLFFGNENSILSSDDNYFVVASDFVARGKNGGSPTGEASFFGSGQAVDLRIKARLNTSNLTSLAIRTELKAPPVSMAGMVTLYVVDMWNWGTGRYEFVALEVLQGGNPMGLDLAFDHAPAGGAARFVNTRNEMWVRLSLLQPGGVQVGGPGGTLMGPGTFSLILDQVGIGSTIIIGNPVGGGGLGAP